MYKSLIEAFNRFIENKVELVKLDIEQRIALLITHAVAIMFFIGMLSLFIVFFSILVALAISTWAESLLIGFGSVSLIYAILAVAAYFISQSSSFKKKLRDNMVELFDSNI
ncbi:phage holin family protein [Mangrovivirga cuniculi]|uniref:Phage holin family protein n=1 Tax=Mangrovivirga cuniculi TaxID=2715131 RepID=A0A4D7JRY4_9BACT|nr:phage holin family protein [Mangrovivirga cuniculi]QCK13685.1 hypothetical protein DCC35_02395 [Mangrovivirga cuniculi]